MAEGFGLAPIKQEGKTYLYGTNTEVEFAVNGIRLNRAGPWITPSELKALIKEHKRRFNTKPSKKKLKGV